MMRFAHCCPMSPPVVELMQTLSLSSHRKKTCSTTMSTRALMSPRSMTMPPCLWKNLELPCFEVWDGKRVQALVATIRGPFMPPQYSVVLPCLVLGPRSGLSPPRPHASPTTNGTCPWFLAPSRRETRLTALLTKVIVLAQSTNMTRTARRIAPMIGHHDTIMTTLVLPIEDRLPMQVDTMIDTARILGIMIDTLEINACGRCTNSNETCHPVLEFQYPRPPAACAGVGSGVGQR